MTTLDPARTRNTTSPQAPTRRFALEQAVALFQPRAHLNVPNSTEIVATAKAFEAFLTRPEETPEED